MIEMQIRKEIIQRIIFCICIDMISICLSPIFDHTVTTLVGLKHCMEN